MLISNPLQYKIWVTKRRLHVVHAVLTTLGLVEFACAFIFLHKDFTQDEPCVIANVVTRIGLYPIFLLNFGIFSTLMIVNYLVVIVKLKQRKKQMSTIMHNRNPNALNTDAKVTRATIIALGTYIIMFLPTVMVTSISSVVEFPHMIILQDLSDLWYCMNNVINPFIYYLLLKDFKEGYKNLLSCKYQSEDSNQQLNQQIYQRRGTERTSIRSIQLHVLVP